VSRLGRRKKRVKRTKASACDGKVRYQTRDAASAQRDKYIEGGSSAESIRVYQCGSCRMFHVGHVYRADLRQVRNGPRMRG
jgi:hypothetical protein